MNHEQFFEFPASDTALSTLMVTAMALVGVVMVLAQAVRMFAA
jgi:hypothetical protein